MKKAFVLLLLISFASCSKMSMDYLSIKEDNVPGIDNTKVHSNNDYKDFIVTEKDVESYISFLNSVKNSTCGHVVSVDPVLSNDEVVYYIINMENGWQLLSADKRGPIVLSNSDTGLFTLEEMIYGFQSLY